MENKTLKKALEKKPHIRKPVDDEMFSFRNRVPILELYYRGDDTVELHTIFDKVSETEIDAAICHIAELTAWDLRSCHDSAVLSDVQELLTKLLANILTVQGDSQWAVSGIERVAKVTKDVFRARTNTKL